MPGTGVNITQMLDLLATTLAKYPKDKYRNFLLQRSYSWRAFLKDLKPEDMEGTSKKFNAMIIENSNGTDATDSGFGRTDGAYDTIPIKNQTYMTQGSAPWAYYIGQWSCSQKEIALNKGKPAYINLGKSIWEGGMTRLMTILESDFQGRNGYQYEFADKPMILGPQYWITDDGYHINDPGGTNNTPVGGISTTDTRFVDSITGEHRWRNQFKQIASANELIDGMDALWTACHFEAPPDVDLNTEPKFKRFRIEFAKPGFLAWKKLMRRFEEPIDESNPRYNNIKVIMSDTMPARSDGTNEGFFENLDTWGAAVEAGHDFHRDPVQTPTNQPGVRVQYFHEWLATWCEDRRSNGKIFGFGDLIEG